MFLRSGGYSVVTDGWGREVKEDTKKCVHCQKIIFVPPGRDPYEIGHYCPSCDALTCRECAGKPCDHFEKKLARAEARDRFRREVDRV